MAEQLGHQVARKTATGMDKHHNRPGAGFEAQEQMAAPRSRAAEGVELLALRRIASAIGAGTSVEKLGVADARHLGENIAYKQTVDTAGPTDHHDRTTICK